MRTEVEELAALGIFPSENKPNLDHIKRIENLLSAILPPVSDQEAVELVKLFGKDSCFGLAWTLLHLIETAPSWPIKECLPYNTNNEWVMLLRMRAKISQ